MRQWIPSDKGRAVSRILPVLTEYLPQSANFSPNLDKTHLAQEHDIARARRCVRGAFQ